MSWLDVLLGLLLLGAIWRGWGRGIVGAVMGIGSLLAALIITRIAARPTVLWLEDRYGWLAKTREALHAAAEPVIGGTNGSDWGLLPVANRILAETYDRLAVTIWTVIFALVLFALISIGLRLLGKAITAGLDATPLALPNRLLGAALNVVLIGSVAGIVCAVLLSLPSLEWQALSESMLAPRLALMAKYLVGAVLGILHANGTI